MPDPTHDAVSTRTFAIRTGPEWDATVITVSGELDLASADRLDEAIRHAEESTTTRWVVVDLEDLSFLDSTGLNVLLEARRRARENGDRLRFVRSRHDQVKRLLSLTETSELLFS
ncbi:MAG: STAS domain-containing protein [Solirubrobacterales bacterium]